jgi:hypothetical protein
VIGVVLALSLASSGPCDDVFDRTAHCDSPDTEGLAVGVDAPGPDRAEVSADDFAWRLLTASGLSAALGGALSVGVFAYDAHLASLRDAGAATPDAVEDALLQRNIVGWAALSGFAASVLLLGSSGAFFLFDPSRGVAREPFRITGE